MKKLSTFIFSSILFFLILIFANSCDQKDIKGIYINDREVNLKEWNREDHIEGKDYELYTYSVENGDTTTFIAIWKFPVGDSSVIKYTYKKRFEDKDFKYYLVGDNDTLSYYRQSKENPDSLYFYRGKYYYDYKHFNLKPGQAEFFENNYDSLINVRGNNLPDLPSDPIKKEG